MRPFDGAPGPLAALSLIGLVVGGWLFLHLVRRAGTRLAGRAQVPIGGARILVMVVLCAVLLGGGIGATGLLVAMRDYRMFTAKTHVAELQCIELAPSRLRLFYVPIEPDGIRGATETYDLAGDQFTVGGDVLRLRPFLTRLGVSTVHRVTRVEGRWNSAAEASARKPTAFDRGGGSTPAWLQLYRDGARGPLGWFVDGAHGQAVSQLPDRRAVFNLYVTPNGYTLEKRAI